MSESLDDKDEIENRDDLISMSHKLFEKVNVKICFFLFMIGMLVFSDLFIETVLNKIAGTVEGECTTTKGTIIQLLFLIIGYILVDILIKAKIL